MSYKKTSERYVYYDPWTAKQTALRKAQAKIIWDADDSLYTVINTSN